MSAPSTVVNLAQAAEVVTWNKKIFSFLGLWPPDRNGLTFALFFIYLSVHVALIHADLIENIDSLGSVVANMTENVIATATLYKIATFRIYRRQLCLHLDAMEEDCREENYKTMEEKKVFMRYMSMARIFVRTAMPATFFTALVYYLRPITGQLGAILHGNASIRYEMPYRTRSLFEVTETHTYILIYACQFPEVLMVTFGFTGMDCLVVTTIFHICGQLSVLALRVNEIPTDPRGFRHAIRSFVERHLQLIRMTKSLDTSLNLVFLGQIMGLSLLISLNGYNVIANSEASQNSELHIFIMYALSLVMSLFTYCYIGECLIQEVPQSISVNPQNYMHLTSIHPDSSLIEKHLKNQLEEYKMNHIIAHSTKLDDYLIDVNRRIKLLTRQTVTAGITLELTLNIPCCSSYNVCLQSMHLQDVFYNCDEWYKLPPANLKLFVICMAQTRKPLLMTAGKFYIFSLASFADVMKTSMAYVSLLRTFL